MWAGRVRLGSKTFPIMLVLLDDFNKAGLRSLSRFIVSLK